MRIVDVYLNDIMQLYDNLCNYAVSLVLLSVVGAIWINMTYAINV